MAQRLLILAAAAALTACAGQASKPTPTPAAAPVPVAPAPKSGLDLAGFDRDVRPQDDLYRFVGGNWLAHTEIPPDRTNYGSFIILEDRAKEEIRALVAAAAQQPNRAAGSDAQKVGDFYNSFMDTARVESLGLDPLAAELAQKSGAASRTVKRLVDRGLDLDLRAGLELEKQQVAAHMRTEDAIAGLRAFRERARKKETS